MQASEKTRKRLYLLEDLLRTDGSGGTVRRNLPLPTITAIFCTFPRAAILNNESSGMSQASPSDSRARGIREFPPSMWCGFVTARWPHPRTTCLLCVVPGCGSRGSERKQRVLSIKRIFTQPNDRVQYDQNSSATTRPTLQADQEEDSPQKKFQRRRLGRTEAQPKNLLSQRKRLLSSRGSEFQSHS